MITDTKDAKNIPFQKARIRLTEGPIFTRLDSILETPFAVTTKYVMLSGKRSISMESEFHLTRGSYLANKELLMRLQTDVNSGDSFFTDLNGFQVSQPFIVLPV